MLAMRRALISRLARPSADPEAERFARQIAVGSPLLDVPSLVLVEDVHRADAASLRLLVHVCREVSGRRALLVATFRPDPAAQAVGFGGALDAIVREARVERLDLTGLDLPALPHLLGPPTSADVARRVRWGTEGTARDRQICGRPPTHDWRSPPSTRSGPARSGT
jgi:hypothetical protein